MVVRPLSRGSKSAGLRIQSRMSGFDVASAASARMTAFISATSVDACGNCPEAALRKLPGGRPVWTSLSSA